jgi:hypothetical protein
MLLVHRRLQLFVHLLSDRPHGETLDERFYGKRLPQELEDVVNKLL